MTNSHPNSLTDWCWQQKLTAPQKLTLLALAHLAPDTSPASIMQITGMKRTTIIAALNALRHARLIDQHRQPAFTPPNGQQPANEQLVEQLYDAYPRKVGRPAGLAAIRAALKREKAKRDLGMPAAEMLAKTQLWAKACSKRCAADPQARQFIKHPATWFNQQSYLEDPGEWGLNVKADERQTRAFEQIMTRQDEGGRKIDEILKNL